MKELAKFELELRKSAWEKDTGNSPFPSMTLITKQRATISLSNAAEQLQYNNTTDGKLRIWEKQQLAHPVMS